MTTETIIAICASLGTYGAILIGVYVKTQTKLKELELKYVTLDKEVVELRKGIRDVSVKGESNYDKLLEKIDEIKEDITEIKIATVKP